MTQNILREYQKRVQWEKTNGV